MINDTTVKTINRGTKRSQKIAMKRCYERKKTDPEYIERQRLSSRTHYYKHNQSYIRDIPSQKELVPRVIAY